MSQEAVERALGGKLEDHFIEFGPPVAAASIAQVHKAVVLDNGVKKTVVKEEPSVKEETAAKPGAEQTKGMKPREVQGAKEFEKGLVLEESTIIT